MPSSPDFFTSYRKHRLQNLAARFSQAPAEAWGEHESLPALFHEQLTLGTHFQLPIQATQRTREDSSAAAALTLNTVSRATVLDSLSADFDDAEYLTVWEILDNASHSLSLLSPVTNLAYESGNVAVQLASEMRNIPGVDPGLDLDSLAQLITYTLTEWAAQSTSATPGEARVIFIGLIYRHLISAFELPVNFWEILLLKLELAIASPVSAPALARLLAPAFRVAWSGLPLQPSLHAFWSIHGQTTGADATVAERITAIAVMARAGGQTAASLRSAFGPDWIASAPSSKISDHDAPWRASITQHLELAAYQPLFEATNQWSRMVSAHAAISEAISSLLPSLRKIADDLSQGMSGSNTSDLYVALASELIARALWVSTLTTNPAEARELFLQPAVRELGLDASTPLWRKLSRLSSSLQQLFSTRTDPLPWANVATLLRALEARATEIKNFPVRWNQAVAEENFAGLPYEATDGSIRCSRDVCYLLQRLAIEHRIHGSQRVGMEIARWYAIHVLPHLVHLPDQSFRERWDVMAEHGFSPQPEHAALNAAARRFGSILPRLTAARKLELHSEEFATNIADEVMSVLPEYSRNVGPAGRISCIRDNTLTLGQVANLLLSDTTAPHESLAEWWNSAVGSYLATRPPRLFEANLAAIFHALSQKLDASEVAEAFSPIQIVYRESLGIECLEALTGPPTPTAGPLARRISAGFSPPEPDRGRFSNLFRQFLSSHYLTNPASQQAILSAYFTYDRERWTMGDSDIALSRLMPLLANPTVLKHRHMIIRGILECAADTSAASDRDALLLAESADNFVMALAQQGVAEELVKRTPEIAHAYSAAMITHAPEHFKHLTKEDAIAKCRRDQALLLRNLGERLAKTSPALYWVDATRWFLELLSPFVDYPADVWALCARTIAKHLGPHLSIVENIFLSRWVSHFEHLAHAWAASHRMAKAAFSPTDYSFSAREEEDRIQRDLLAAALVARFAPEQGPWSGKALLCRYLMSWPASTRTMEEIHSILANIRQVAGEAIPTGVSAWLDQVPSLISALSAAEGQHPSERYAHATGLSVAEEQVRAYDLYLTDGPDLDIWRHVRTSYHVGPDLSLATAAVRAHLLHPYDTKKPRSMASEFPAAARSRAGLVSAVLDASFEPLDWTKLIDTLLPHAANPNTLRSHFTTLTFEWSAVRMGLALAKSANAQAAAMLGKLEGGSDVAYSSQAAECDSRTNTLAFGYAFRQAGISAWEQYAEPPRLFFGYAADNHRKLPTLVAARAHARVNAELRKALPAGSARAGDAIFGIEAPLFAATAPLWRSLMLDSRASSSVYVRALFPAILEIAKDAASYAFAEDDSRCAIFAERLSYHLEALVCTLDESGDIESAWEIMMLRMSTDLEQWPAADMIFAFYGLTRDLSKHLDPGPALFWRACFMGTLEVVRQAALGRYILKHAATIAGMVSKEVEPDDEEKRIRCTRDQEHLLALLGHLLATQAPVRAWLNFSSHLTETTLPHLSHSALELASIWCRHESTISSHLAPELRPALWTWMGALQRTSRNMPAVRPFVAEVVPALADKLAAQQGDDPAHWRRILCAVAASAATPDEGPAPGVALIEKALLSSPLHRSHMPQDWAGLSELIASECEKLLPGNVPNSLKRRFLAIPSIAARLDVLMQGKGSRLVRACAAQASHPLSLPLWQASLLARARKAERLVESDPADSVAASAFGQPLKSDEDILAVLAKVLDSVGAASRIPLSRTKSGGILSALGLGKKAHDWANDPELREHGNYVVEVLTLRSCLSWLEPSHLWYWTCPRTIEMLHSDKEAGMLEFYQALAPAVSASLGEAHPATAELASFASQAHSRMTGLKLIPPKKGKTGPLPLYLLGARLPADIPTYAHIQLVSPELVTELIGQTKSLGRPLTEAQTTLVRKAQEEVQRHASLA